MVNLLVAGSVAIAVWMMAMVLPTAWYLLLGRAEIRIIPQKWCHLDEITVNGASYPNPKGTVSHWAPRDVVVITAKAGTETVREEFKLSGSRNEAYIPVTCEPLSIKIDRQVLED